MHTPRPGFGAALRQEVESILGNAAFTRTPAQARLLRLLCERTLSDDAGSLSQYAIAVDGMGKSISFDPTAQSNVRVQACRLRHKLAKHYAVFQPCAELCVYLKPGSYKLHLGPIETAYPNSSENIKKKKSVENYEHEYATLYYARDRMNFLYLLQFLTLLLVSALAFFHNK